MTRPSFQAEDLRTSAPKEIARIVTAPRFTFLLVALAVFVGFGVGNRIASTAHAHSKDSIESDRAGLSLFSLNSALDPSLSAAGDVRAMAQSAEDEYVLAANQISATLGGDTFNAGDVSFEGPSTHSTNYTTQHVSEHAPDPGAPEWAGAFTIITHGEIGPGESLGVSLDLNGVSASAVNLIASEMGKIFDFRLSKAGDRYRLGQDADGRVLDFRYSQDSEESYYLAWEGTRYTIRKETAELHAQIAKIAGVVDSSFYGAISALGEETALAADFAEVFAWDIDFSRNVHPGDEFSILYERLYRRDARGEEVYVRPGRILAGRYKGKVGDYTVVYFDNDIDGGAYFRPDGTSVERAFLAAPLEFSRISSRFTGARNHPILNVTRPHPGIDYAAPHGTPVYAVAQGVIDFKARAGASGNLIRIRHPDGYSSHYAHLSKFANSLKVGDRIKQKQVIGYVGSTGLSTGPHVCFRVKKDGHYVDPMKISSPAGAPVESNQLDDFMTVRDMLLAHLGPGSVTLADEAL